MARKQGYPLLRKLIRTPLWILTGLVLFTILQVLLLRFIDPLGTPLMVYRWIQGDGWDYRWRTLAKISPYLQQAVMASEDQKFLHHEGFDWEQMERAMEENQRRARHRGASTITMQAAKNLFLWQGQSWARKGIEAYYVILIELIWPKWRIMEVYLNIAEWGRGIYGAEAAARRHFGSPASSLTREHAALMAAVLPNPRRWSPARPTPYIEERKHSILGQMDQFRPLKKGVKGQKGQWGRPSSPPRPSSSDDGPLQKGVEDAEERATIEKPLLTDEEDLQSNPRLESPGQ